MGNGVGFKEGIEKTKCNNSRQGKNNCKDSNNCFESRQYTNKKPGHQPIINYDPPIASDVTIRVKMLDVDIDGKIENEAGE